MKKTCGRCKNYISFKNEQGGICKIWDYRTFDNTILDCGSFKKKKYKIFKWNKKEIDQGIEIALNEKKNYKIIIEDQ